MFAPRQKQSVLSLRLLFCGLACFIFGKCSPGYAEERLTIGFVLPLTGDWAFLGKGVRDASLLAEKDSAVRKYPPRLVFEDNGGDLTKSASAAAKLISVEKVDALVSIISGVGLVLQPIAERAKVLNFGLCSNTTVANGKHSFTNYITTPEGAGAYLKELQKRYPAQVRLGIFSLNEAGFNQIVSEIRRQRADTPVQIEFVESFEPGTNDFRSQIVKAMRTDTDAVLLLALSPEVETFSRQFRSLGKNTPLSSVEAFGLAEHKKEFDGTWFIDAAAPTQAFEERFRKAYGRDLTAAAAHAYDVVQLLGEVYQRAGDGTRKPTTTEVAEYLREQKEFSGIVGPLSVDSSGIIHSIPSVKTIRGGKGIVERENQ